ncbi:cytosolic sulfotransferase 15-like [Syzygium oleosum]|uniref:cytosolic sulfotransferase 15-like n=1 Tax=Syzygium oleosum TaxID=219896 RepID=UPI0024B8832C|nr:cytosolic sulfotransferase 15-like [Syzygium oleosum]
MFENHVPIGVAANKFCSGVVPFGPYYEHVLKYWKERLARPGNVFFITYEELKDDPKRHVKWLTSLPFLGCPFNVDGENKVVKETVRECSFECISKHEVNKSSNSPTWFELPYHHHWKDVTAKLLFQLQPIIW